MRARIEATRGGAGNRIVGEDRVVRKDCGKIEGDRHGMQRVVHPHLSRTS